MPDTVLLFDIDGTLIVSGGAGAIALEQAFNELTGVARALEGVLLDGATDVAIVREALTRAGKDAPDALIAQLIARYTELLPHSLSQAEKYRLLDGVEHILGRLTNERRAFGLCTGNVREGARHKLSRGNVWHHFERGFGGGFGGDGEVRADIVRAALRRASEHHGETLPAAALVIGDTPRDVSAAHAVGVPALAVASGRFSVDELRASGADDVVESLASPEALRLLGLG